MAKYRTILLLITLIGSLITACHQTPPAPLISITPSPSAILVKTPTNTPSPTSTITPTPLPTVTSSPISATLKQISSAKTYHFLPSDQPNLLVYGARPMDTPDNKRHNTHPLLQDWFQVELPNGNPIPIDYPHKHIFTDELREHLGLTPFRNYENWFDLLFVSPNGEHLIYLKLSENSGLPHTFDIWQASTDGRKTKHIVKNVPTSLRNITWSYDGEYVLITLIPPIYGIVDNYYWINLKTNHFEVFEDKTTFTLRIWSEQISPNGEIVAGADVYDFELKTIEVDTGDEQRYGIPIILGQPVWSTDGTALYLFDDEWYLNEVDLKTGNRTLLATIPANYATIKHAIFRWAIFPDKRMFAIGSANGVWVGQY